MALIVDTPPTPKVNDWTRRESHYQSPFGGGIGGGKNLNNLLPKPSTQNPQSLQTNSDE